MARDTVSATHARHQGRACHPASLSRPSTIPARSDTVLVTSPAYDSAGNLSSQTDPAGMPTCLEYDAADREITKITNCVSGSSSSSSSSGGEACAASDDANITVRTTYNADGNVATLTAVNSATGDQVTQYIYGTTLADSAIAASTLKRAEIYPDSVDDDDRITFSYNRQGQSVGMRDQNGTVHAYDYDLLGRPTQDRVTTLGSGVDGAVRRIGTTYEVRGMKATMTSYDNATIGSGNVLNQCQFVYNDFGQLTTEYQSHSGTVNVSTTPKVQYTFANGSSNTIRTTGLVYPSGRVLTYAYGGTGSISDRSSRIASIIDDDDTHLCDYSYLGLQTFVEQDDTEPQMKWTLIDLAGTNDPDTGDIYSGLDRFGRVKDVRWRDVSAASDLSRVQYGYDRASNRTFRRNASDTANQHDWLYGYDGLHRLQDAGRGTLVFSGSQPSALSPQLFSQCWTLDPTGNWQGFRQADSGDPWDLVQARMANPVNEITAITNSTGPAWAQPAYDGAGNMTTIPQPADPTESYTATYDAWNRLVKLVDPATGHTVQENEYDGRGFRTVRKSYTAGTLSETRHYYYTDGWRDVEERVGTSPDAADAERQFVWGGRYIDDLVLRDRGSERLYACQDANWNVTAVVDDAGSVQERYEYDPYGQLTVLSPAFVVRADCSFDWETTYAGYRFDAATGLCFVRHREFARTISWLQRDPSPPEYNLNMYEYALGSPVNWVDPLGLINIGGGPLIPGGPHQPGGPWEPALPTRCTGNDSCPVLIETIRAIQRQHREHRQWDQAHPDPRWPDGRHALEIAEMLNALARCFRLYEQECRRRPPCPPRPQPQPVPVRVPVPNPQPLPTPIVRTILGGIVVIILIFTPIPGDEIIIGGALLAI